jgi:hypothetical protein
MVNPPVPLQPFQRESPQEGASFLSGSCTQQRISGLYECASARMEGGVGTVSVGSPPGFSELFKSYPFGKDRVG